MTIRSDTGPFSIVPHWLLQSGASSRAVRLYALLGRYADNESGQAHPGRSRLAAELNCSVDSLDRAVKELVEAGALEVEARFAGSERQTNLYTLKRAAPVRLGVAADLRLGGRTDAAQTRTRELDSEELGGAAPVRPRDPVWDSFTALFGEPSNKNAHGRRNLAVKLVKESLDHQGLSDPELIATEIRSRARMWPRLFEGATLTDTALANNWDRLTPPRKLVPSSKPAEPEADYLPPEENAERMRELLESMQQIGRSI